MKTTKYQDGGRTISAKAAERKSAKGKGLYVPTDRTKSKGLYVGYNRAGRKEVEETGGTEGYNLKPIRKVMKTGGMVKKYQNGGRTADQKIESGVRKNYIANAKAKLMGVAAAARKSSERKGKI